MAMTTCRECGGHVSSEALMCPHCGVRSPAAVPDPTPATTAPVIPQQMPHPTRSRPKWGRILILVGVIGTVIGIAAQHTGAKMLDATQLEQTLETHYGPIVHADVTASCPRKIPMKKDLIADCTITREDSGKTTVVRVRQNDGSGHFSYQASDPLGFATP